MSVHIVPLNLLKCLTTFLHLYSIRKNSTTGITTQKWPIGHKMFTRCNTFYTVSSESNNEQDDEREAIAISKHVGLPGWLGYYYFDHLCCKLMSCNRDCPRSGGFVEEEDNK